jgi:hypothetical protein
MATIEDLWITSSGGGILGFPVPDALGDTFVSTNQCVYTGRDGNGQLGPDGQIWTDSFWQVLMCTLLSEIGQTMLRTQPGFSSAMSPAIDGYLEAYTDGTFKYEPNPLAGTQQVGFV